MSVRLRLRPAARWIAEYYATTELEEREDGGVEATLPARQLGWVARLLVRVGDAVAGEVSEQLVAGLPGVDVRTPEVMEMVEI